MYWFAVIQINAAGGVQSLNFERNDCLNGSAIVAVPFGSAFPDMQFLAPINRVCLAGFSYQSFKNQVNHRFRLYGY